MQDVNQLTTVEFVQTAENFIICEKSVITIFSIKLPNTSWQVIEFFTMFIVINDIGCKLT